MSGGGRGGGRAATGDGAASSRWSSHPSIVVECPVCGRGLPRIVIDVDARSGVRWPERRVVIELSARAQNLNAAWWRAARADHPSCIPPDVGVSDGDGPVAP